MTFAHLATRMSLPVALMLGVALVTAGPVAAGANETTQFEQVAQVAKSKLGAPWVHYAKGPARFDCVGFVWYAFNQNGLKDMIGGYRGVKGYFNWFKNRGLASTSNPKPGDLIIWGDFKHAGIYLGDGMAISSLINPYGVTVHKVTGYIKMKVKAYLHVDIER